MNILYVPKLVTNLMSVIQLEECGIAIATNSSGAIDLLYKGKTVGHATQVGRSYILDTVNRPRLASLAKPAPSHTVD